MSSTRLTPAQAEALAELDSTGAVKVFTVPASGKEAWGRERP